MEINATKPSQNEKKFSTFLWMLTCRSFLIVARHPFHSRPTVKLHPKATHQHLYKRVKRHFAMEITDSSIAPSEAKLESSSSSNSLQELPMTAEVTDQPKVRLSKAEKRAIAQEKRKEYWKAKRVTEKANKKRKTAELKMQILEAGGDPRLELKTGKDNQEYKLKKRKLHEMDFSAQKVVIDLGFDAQMTEKEIRSLVSQLTHCYGKNRMAEHPLQLYLTEFGGQAESHVRLQNGFENWKGLNIESKPYLELFDKDKLVYLSAESEIEVTELNENDIYIIGGLVDHNRLKGICHQKAAEQGIRTARLPIGSFMELKTRKVLTVNQVFEILLNWTIHKDWAKAFEEFIPKRKGGQVLPHNEATSSQQPNDLSDQPSTAESSNENSGLL